MKLKNIIATAMGTLLIGGVVAASVVSSKQTTAIIPPTPPPQNPQWLMEPTASLEYSLYQALALIDNDDPSVGELGIYQQLLLERAIDFSATASQAIRDKQHPCFQKTLACPYNLIEKGLKADWGKQSSADGKAAIIFRYRALLQARHGAIMPPKETGALFPRVIERLSQDRELSDRLSLNGIGSDEGNDEGKNEN